MRYHNHRLLYRRDAMLPKLRSLSPDTLDDSMKVAALLKLYADTAKLLLSIQEFTESRSSETTLWATVSARRLHENN
jgi:hypothetical protein